MSNADRFLATFNKIERHLRQVTNSDKSITFSMLVTTAARNDAAVRRYEIDLKEFADLRNAIVHERTDGRAIAEPYDRTVVELDAIAAVLLNPPRLIPRFQSKVATLAISDPISAAVAMMFQKSFSQLPIYADDQFIALLTTNTIARWLGASIDDDVFSLSETVIGAVLEFTEDPGNVCFLSRNSTVFDALQRFQQWEERGARLDAILITGDGRPSKGLLGIITVHDLPAITTTRPR